MNRRAEDLGEVSLADQIKYNHRNNSTSRDEDIEKIVDIQFDRNDHSGKLKQKVILNR